MGSKGITSQYDPQLGAAAAANAQTAADSLAFSKDYFTNTISPLLQKQQAQADISSGQQNQIFDTTFPLLQQQADMQTRYALPAQQRFYDLAGQYSSAAEADREAGIAQSDSEQANAAQNAAMTRRFASLGISANSPAAIEASQSAAVQNAANQVGAMTRARAAAKAMGMSISSQAAGFGNTGAQNVGSYGQGAGAASTGAFGIANGALSGADAAANPMFEGYNTALKGYDSNASMWGKVASANIAADASQSLGAGLGKLVGAGLTAGKNSVFGGLLGM